MKLASLRSQQLVANAATDRITARWAVAALLGTMFAGSTMITPLYVIYQQAWNFSQITLTLVYAAYIIGNLTALLVLGRISDYIGRKRISLPAIALAACSTFIFFNAKSAAWLAAGRALSGLAISMASSTTTAWIAELHMDRQRAAIAATVGNSLGLAFGALFAGLLVQYAPAPLHLTYLVYLAILAIMCILIGFVPETVTRRALQASSLRPQISVPKNIRTAFIPPACAAFGAFALVGFYAALAPSILKHQLHVDNHAVSGLILFELCAVAAVAAALSHSMNSRAAMKGGLLTLIPSVLLLVWAQAAGSLSILLIGTAISGISAALGYRGSLQVVNELAPPDRRAALVSAYLIVAFSANSIPVIGIGVLSTLTNAVTATLAFAIVLSLCSLVALAVSTQYERAQRPA